LSQLQMAFVRIGGAARSEAPPQSEPSETPSPASEPGAPGAAEAQEPPKPGEPGPAQRSGRLWVPGQ
jgi:hypothetical protein